MGTMVEAGSYRNLTQVPISKSAIKSAWKKRAEISIKIQAKGERGLSVDGKEFGRYPVDSALVNCGRQFESLPALAECQLRFNAK
jgi:hypothetical protein